jgi:hypothetical protein
MLSLCLPSIEIRPHQDGPILTYSCDLTFPTRAITTTNPETTKPGQCWYKLFRNPVIVEGYPIPRRSRYNSGLEIPLNMMSRLAESPRLHQYMGKHLLKGFSTAVFPTETLEDALLWHLHCTDDGSRLPYPDLGGTRCFGMPPHEMTSRRHILGWCSEAKLCAGESNLLSRLRLPT